MGVLNSLLYIGLELCCLIKWQEFINTIIPWIIKMGLLDDPRTLAAIGWDKKSTSELVTSPEQGTIERLQSYIQALHSGELPEITPSLVADTGLTRGELDDLETRAQVFGTLGTFLHDVANLRTTAEYLTDQCPDFSDLDTLKYVLQILGGHVANLRADIRRESVSYTPLDLNLIVTQSESFVTRRKEFPKDVYFVYDLVEDLPKVMGEITQVVSIFYNLYANAADALRNKKGSNTIKVKTQYDGLNVIVEVTDNGYGMNQVTANRVRDKILADPNAAEAFSTKRVDDGNIGGYGYGLKGLFPRVLQPMGANLEIYSVLSQGTTFRMSFRPYLQQDTSLDGSVSTGTTTDTTGYDIMLLEDAPFIRRGMEKLFTNLGYVVHSYGAAEDALEQSDLLRNQIVLFVDDELDGKMAGSDFYLELWNSGIRPPTVFTSGNIDLQDQLDHPNVAYLPKPFEGDVAQNTIVLLLNAVNHVSPN